MIRTCLTVVVVAAAAALSACATVEPVKVSELAAGVKTVAFVQNGKVPMKYTIGAVDGTTSWSNYSIMGARLNEKDRVDPSPTIATGNTQNDIAVGAGLEIVSGVGKAIADKSMKDDPAYYDRLLARMVGSRELAAEAGAGVLPSLARTWNVAYTPANLRVFAEPQKLDDPAGRYVAADPGTDLVLTFTMTELLLSEKPSARALKSVVTFGMYDKEVMPYITAVMSAYRRQPGGELKRVWTTACTNDFADAPAQEWTVLRAAPERAGALFDGTVPRLVHKCETTLRKLVAST